MTHENCKPNCKDPALSDEERREREITCSKCGKDVIWNYALTRRNCGYDHNARICDDCSDTEAIIDMRQSMTSQMLEWEYSFQLMCGGNADKHGPHEFNKFMIMRKVMGKMDPPLWQVHLIVMQKTFPNLNEEKWLEAFKPHYEELETKMTEVLVKKVLLNVPKKSKVSRKYIIEKIEDVAREKKRKALNND